MTKIWGYFPTEIQEHFFSWEFWLTVEPDGRDIAEKIENIGPWCWLNKTPLKPKICFTRNSRNKPVKDGLDTKIGR